MAILAPFILTRIFDEIPAAQALKRNLILAQDRSARFWGSKLIALWVAVARVNYFVFNDEISCPKSLDTMVYYIAEERDLLLEVGHLVKGFEKATPNFHVGLHIPEQVYMCIPSSCSAS
jgi:hypothetical protein